LTTPTRRIRIEWIALIGILWLALGLRLIWVRDGGFVYDIDFFVRAMRLAAQGGAGLVFSATESSYPPLTVYLLELLGRFSLSVAPGVPTTLSELVALRVATVFFDLVTIGVLYGLGRRIAGYKAALGAALLYALCPGGIYLSGW
jgi:hypothetical protein